METIYTMRDILKYRKAAYLAARVSGQDIPLELAEIAGYKPLKPHYGQRLFALLAVYFEPFLPGLTEDDLETIYKQFTKEADKKRKERKGKLKPCTFQGKFAPLGKEVYEHFAEYVWEKRNPVFGVKVSKAKWGKPQIITHRLTDNEMTYEYIAGCEISTNLRGKKLLKLSIAD